MILFVDFSKKEDKQRLYDTLKNLKPKLYKVELKEDRDIRSNRQNRYYWGVVIKLLSDHIGEEPEEMHELLKAKFLRSEKVLPTGEVIYITKHTWRLDTGEFEQYIERIRRFAAKDLDVIIPEPGQYLEL